MSQQLTCIENPLTKNLIIVNGKVYKKLKELGINVNIPTVKCDTATYLKSKTASGWHADAPLKKGDRKQVANNCGAEKCFLRPENLGYPICKKCDSDGCTCQVDCRGLRAAYYYAKKYKSEKIANAAINIARKVGCEWNN